MSGTNERGCAATGAVIIESLWKIHDACAIKSVSARRPHVGVIVDD